MQFKTSAFLNGLIHVLEMKHVLKDGAESRPVVPGFPEHRALLGQQTALFMLEAQI